MREPKAIPGTTEYVSLEWALKNLTGSVDGFDDDEGVDWSGMLANKGRDGQFASLVLSMLAIGFTVPVCFWNNGYDAGWSMGNGHHRMAAAILLGLDEVFVYWSENGDYMHTHRTDNGDHYAHVDNDEAIALEISLDEILPPYTCPCGCMDTPATDPPDCGL